MSSIKPFSSERRGRLSAAAELEGTLLMSSNPLSYYMLVAFEAGSPFRALALLLAYPIILSLNLTGYEEAAISVMIFLSTAGIRVAEVKAVAKATLCRFYLEDLRESAYKVFSSCGGEKYVITSFPRIMVEPFLREYLDVDRVIATELTMIGSYCSGIGATPGVMAGGWRLLALRSAMVDGKEMVDVGIGSGLKDHPFMLVCREKYVVPLQERPQPLQRRDYPRPLIFHDGRFVVPPTPLNSVAIFLWMPLGILMAILRLLVGLILPYKLGLLGIAATGIRIRAQFPKAQQANGPRKRGTLYVCSHRTLLDPVIISTALQHKVTAVTYSVSRFSELISPIPTARLSRDRARDGKAMQELLDKGDLVVCPEGTTCREPYLLRFSPLFAEVADNIVPVAIAVEGSLFFGTTVRGYKCLDSFFFLMNPWPCYWLDFLERVEGDQGSSYDVANGIQRSIGCSLGYECTNLTRRDKYRMLAGTDGVDTRRLQMLVVPGSRDDILQAKIKATQS